MGQQQILIIVLGVILVGLAVATGVTYFTGASVASNRDGIVHNLAALGGMAYGYKLGALPLGGGGTTYQGFTIPSKFTADENATYTSTVSDSSVTLTAVSKLGYGTISSSVNGSGNLSEFTYTGQFH